MLTRILVIAGIVLGAPALAGCALPRTAGLYLSTLTDAPVPPRATGKRLNVSVHAMVGVEQDAGFSTQFESSQPVHELLEFYRAHWKSQGWIETAAAPPALLKCVRKWSIGSGNNALVLLNETIELRADDQRDKSLDRSKQRTLALITKEGWYLWDEPSRWPMNLLKATLGQYAGGAEPLVLVLILL